MKLYKSLKKGMKSENGKVSWEIGEWKQFEGKLEMCQRGFHGSERIIDAMKYVSPALIAEVEVKGKNIKEGDE